MNGTRSRTLCLIADDRVIGESLVDRLELEGLDCDWYKEGGEALRALEHARYAAIVSDVRLADIDGESLLRRVQDRARTAPPTLFIVRSGSIDQAVRLLRMGARDYVATPFDLDDLVDKLRAVCPTLFSDEVWQEREAVLGITPAMRHLQDVLARAAERGARLLLSGEAGVGKRHAARYFHARTAARDDRPFIAVDCNQVPETLLEAELFGPHNEASTGGAFERARDGTVLLHEVGEASLAMQEKLLRALDLSARLVCTTARDLEKLVAAGQFREDLFYRLNVVHARVPPLRERPEDTLWLARMFLERHAAAHGVNHVLSAAAERHLLAQSWPGNVRELEHTIERALGFAEDTVIEVDDLGPERAQPPIREPAPRSDLRGFVEQCEHEHILRVLREHSWRVAETANALQISRKNLWEKMRRYGIQRRG